MKLIKNQMEILDLETTKTDIKKSLEVLKRFELAGKKELTNFKTDRDYAV